MQKNRYYADGSRCAGVQKGRHRDETSLPAFGGVSVRENASIRRGEVIGLTGVDSTHVAERTSKCDSKTTRTSFALT